MKGLSVFSFKNSVFSRVYNSVTKNYFRLEFDAYEPTSAVACLLAFRFKNGFYRFNALGNPKLNI